MNSIFLKDVEKYCNGKILIGNENEVLENFVVDTREINKGDIYVGRKGSKCDSNLLYEEAFDKGAKVCILQKQSVEGQINIEEIAKKYPGRAIVLIEDSTKTLQEIAEYKRSLYNIPVVGITGSVGKTSTKDIIASVVAQKYHTLKTIGNFNSQVGLPLTVLRLQNHNAMVVEMGMSQKGEISNLTKIAKPSIAVITNVGTAHIGILGSRENILNAKLEIVEGLQDGGTLVINNDNDMLHKWHEENRSDKYNVVTFGIENESDIMAEDVVMTENGSTYKVRVNGKEYNVNIAVGGMHFVLNSLCAIAVGNLLDIEMEDILKGIANFELTKRRMQVEKNNIEVTIINDCYNANYDSVKAALEYLGKIDGSRKIAVLGDMLELGEYSKKLHEDVGKEVYKNKIDILLTVGELSKDIAKKAIDLGMKAEDVHTFENNVEAIDFLNETMKKGDIVLLKASNGMNFQEIYEKIK